MPLPSCMTSHARATASWQAGGCQRPAGALKEAAWRHDTTRSGQQSANGRHHPHPNLHDHPDHLPSVVCRFWLTVAVSVAIAAACAAGQPAVTCRSAANEQMRCGGGAVARRRRTPCNIPEASQDGAPAPFDFVPRFFCFAFPTLDLLLEPLSLTPTSSRQSSDEMHFT